MMSVPFGFAFRTIDSLLLASIDLLFELAADKK